MLQACSAPANPSGQPPLDALPKESALKEKKVELKPTTLEARMAKLGIRRPGSTFEG